GAARAPVGKLLGGDPAEKRELAVLASPVTHATRNAPPFLIVHGDEDKTVPLAQAEFMEQALKKAGVPVTLYVAKGQGHGLGGPEIAREVREFCARPRKATTKGVAGLFAGPRGGVGGPLLSPLQGACRAAV